MSRLFISHSSKNDDWAIALRDWLVREGWSGPDDIFLDLDPERGISAGQRWVHALEDAATRCEAVLFLVSEDWLASKWCADEYQLASRLNKKLFALLIADIRLDRLPGGLSAQWQVVRLTGEPAERFLTVHPRTRHQAPVHIAEAGLRSLKRGLEKAGIGAETFELESDPGGPFGWRAPYRGLEALEPEDAAVFFGRSADIVRGIDALRGLAARRPPRLLVVLGASGAGKSSFLRAGLWPRLLRDDSQWLPLRAIRAGRGGAIEGSEGLLAALEEAHRRFALRATRAELRQRLATREHFLGLLRDLRQAAARRALLTEPPHPLPVLCLDQGEELFVADAGAESEELLRLARAATDGDEALLLVTIRSDAYGLMQSAKTLAGIDQVPLSLGPVPHGEIARIIREPSEILRRKAGPAAPVFDPAVVERLQAEIEGETDALPLLAFVLQRLVREHTGAATVGLAELEHTGGVAAAIESAAEAAFTDAGLGPDHAERRELLRRLFIPRLARIDRESKAPQRRIARQSELPTDLLPLARALTARRLLVVKLAAQAEGAMERPAATLEVAHEALLRRWPTLAELLAEDRDALLLLDGVLLAAADWERAEAVRKSDFLAHRGSRLADAQALASRAPDWERAISPARAYLAACQERETAERAEREATLAREQARLAEIAAAQARTAHLQRRARRALVAIALFVAASIGLVYWQYHANLHLQTSLTNRQLQLDHAQVNLLAELATVERLRSKFDGALRFGIHAARLSLRLEYDGKQPLPAHAALVAAVSQSDWRLSLSGHEHTVTRADFNPDGSHIVTAAFDRTARIWDAASGKEIAVLRGHEGQLRFATFSPDGTRIVTASADKTARIWDVATAKEVAVLRGHDRLVSSAKFSFDGKRIVTAAWDGTARIWDTATATEVMRLQGSGFLSAAFSPDGKRVVTTSRDGAVRIWDAATAKEVALVRGHQGWVWFGTFSPDGSRILTTSEDKTARIWDVATAEEIGRLPHGDTVWSAAFDSDGSRIVTASEDRTIRIWDTATAKELAVRRGHEAAVWSAVFSPDGSHVLSASEDKTARIWDAAPAKELLVIHGHENQVKSAAFSPDGSRIITASNDKTARIWNAMTGDQVVVLHHEDAVWSGVFSADGRYIVTASTDKTARVWDAATANGTVVLRGHEGAVFFAAFSRNGKYIVTASEDKTARIWDAATAKEITSLRGHQDGVKTAAFSPDGSRIVTASLDQTARVWDATSGTEVAILRGHQNDVLSAVFSPDGSRILTSSWDSTARIWDAWSGQEITVLRGHESYLRLADFSPDGLRIVTASDDRTARIWETATAKEITVLRGHEHYLWSAAFSPDGSRVVTASFDHTVRIWDVYFTMMSTKELIAEVCLRRLRGLTTLSRDEMRLAGYPDDTPQIDVCAGIE